LELLAAQSTVQWGAWIPASDEISAAKCRVVAPDGSVLPGTPWPWPSEFGHAAAMRRTSKKAAGRLLDGRVWDEFPAPVRAVTHV
jgi:hypothetical protein